MKGSFQPRRPNDQELKQLQEFILKSEYEAPGTEDRQEVSDQVLGAYIAVFDYYVTDSVGYSGKIMTVVWPTSPGRYELYYWVEGKICFQKQE